jgi:hypothetical protein
MCELTHIIHGETKRNDTERESNYYTKRKHGKMWRNGRRITCKEYKGNNHREEEKQEYTCIDFGKHERN